MQKQFCFFCALPRSGSTLLSSLLNQTNQIKVSANSIVTNIIAFLSDLKLETSFKNFPYHKGIDNIAFNILNLYYYNINTKVVLDKSPWGTKFNLQFLQWLFQDRKFILLTRPILECLASFIKAEKPNNVLERCEQLMSKEGMIGKNLISIQNIINQKENYILISYEDLIKNTKKEIDKIFNFLNLEHEEINYNKIEQFNFDGVTYNDSVLFSDLHTIKTNAIEQTNYKIDDYLPKEIIKKYEHIDIRSTWIR